MSQDDPVADTVVIRVLQKVLTNTLVREENSNTRCEQANVRADKQSAIAELERRQANHWREHSNDLRKLAQELNRLSTRPDRDNLHRIQLENRERFYHEEMSHLLGRLRQVENLVKSVGTDGPCALPLLANIMTRVSEVAEEAGRKAIRVRESANGARKSDVNWALETPHPERPNGTSSGLPRPPSDEGQSQTAAMTEPLPPSDVGVDGSEKKC
jgi:hypothetical protein